MNKRDQILQAAQETFGKHGFAATTVKMIAERAGVAFGLVAHYFGKKENLFITAGFEMIDTLLEEIRKDTATAKSGAEAVGLFVRSYLNFTLEHRETFPILVRCSPFSDVKLKIPKEKIADKFRDILGEIAGHIERGIEDGSIREVPVEETSFLIYGNIVGAVRTTLITPYQLPNLYNETIRYIMRSIAKGEAPEIPAL